ncbi:hypothetical protein [Thermodesulforhabdus norvegica]|uniref:Uncharacterized protein n=1 Tax=Thermodesulforhabdus norvegica TaxID=39841 RepID=A0A1I4SF07_9BACT|nr:hypothetical protein [Thermodesulforhabdus norvegica]SFM62921.1 hypothetical protein SAMN05660836_00923 [Thermodesulforhabdus norvegica]
MKRLITAIFAILALFSLPCMAGQPEYEEICKYLVDLDGWKGNQCEGIKMSGSPMGSMVTAHKTYVQGDKELEAHVFYGAMAADYWSNYDRRIEIDSSEGLVKTLEVNGFHVGISYDKKDHGGAVVVSLANSQDAPAVFMISFKNMSWEDALEIARQFDWQALRSLNE